ncbi:MAG TPA: tetratricopeptide repeat protein, partial [Vicinamibacterales bacterium]|nr:tetratricopeptide repeat protein [Vicinamibacterales bacterium]
MSTEPRRRFGCRLYSVGALLVAVALIAGCATRRAAPPTPTTLAHPEFVYPRVPASLATAPGASRVDVGWRYLQVNDLKNADLEFGVALKLGPKLYPARAGQGYVALARRDYNGALKAFDAALESDASYVPALVGKGQALLADDKTDLALAVFERALIVDPSLTDLNR